MKSYMPYFFALLCLAFALGCTTPEERATGRKGAGKTDSTLNSPPKDSIQQTDTSRLTLPDSTSNTDSGSKK